MLDDLKTSKIELNGIQYHVRDSQKGKETVLLLHGWSDDGTVWRKQMPALIEADYRVICPDLPGYGLTEVPSETQRCQLGNLVSDLITLLEQLNLNQVHCIAHDYGAVLGWELAANTKLLKTYIAMSVGHLAEFLTISLENLKLQWLYLLNIQKTTPQLYRANNSYLFHEVLRSHPDSDRIIATAFKPDPLANMEKMEIVNPVPEYLLTALVEQLPIPEPIDIPTLGIWSEEDEFLWESQMKNSGKYVSSDWEYIRIEHAGHWFMLEQPDNINQLLLSWLKKHS